jgi:hypothetical protein
VLFIKVALLSLLVLSYLLTLSPVSLLEKNVSFLPFVSPSILLVP